MKHSTYTASEPIPVEGYQSDRGEVFATREDAIKDNFEQDFIRACQHFETASRAQSLPLQETMVQFARAYPDMLRILVGDRGYT